jgi:hypothetical protein
MDTGKNAPYFPHDCDAKDDPKIMLLIAQLGLEAYGIYWILVEYLRSQRGYRAPLLLLDALSRRYGSSREKFEAVATRFELFVIENEEFYSCSLSRRMLPLDAKRQRMKQLALQRWNPEAIQSQSAGNAYAYSNAMQSREEKSRVKKSKKDKIRVEESNKPNSDLLTFSHSDFIPIWQTWTDYKTQIGKPYKTLKGMQGQLDELIRLSGSDPVIAEKIVNQSIKREWAGLFELKSDKNNFAQTQTGLLGIDAIKKARSESEKNKINGN